MTQSNIDEYQGLPFGEMVDLSSSFFERDKKKWYRNMLYCYVIRALLAVKVMEKVFHPD